MSIGDNILYLRNKYNISQTELSKAINVGKQNLYKYEKGIITNIPSDKVEAIANFFSVSPAFIMGWEKEEVQAQQCENYEECQKKDIKPLISKILQLDERDKGKISERVDMLLESDKYNYQKELKHA